MKRTVISSLIAFAALFIMVSGAQAYEFYSVGVSDTGMCANCHTGFRDTNPYLSAKDGGASWGDSLHNAHLGNTTIGSSCDNCHGGAGTSQRQTNLSSSGNAADGVNAISCSGCHEGVGLRAHHAANGITECAVCHPGDPTPPAENVAPPWYGSVVNNSTGTNLEPCNANGEEDFAGSTLGLDNDGDNAYDTADSDCAGPVCGDGTVDPGETCDDGAANGDTTCGCQTDCTLPSAGTSCEDGEFCNGEETCDGAGTCDAGTAVVCDDGVGCTDDSCNEAGDTCTYVPNNASCDDGQFCTGAETCDPANDCVSQGDPCVAGTTCNEGTDTCDQLAQCGDGNLDAGEECDDGAANGTTTCGCQNDCTYTAATTSCADGAFCNGDETCDGAGSCQAGTPVDCGDGVGCTEDICDEAGDACVNIADDTNCPDDGSYCNGSEYCDEANDCTSTGDPCLAGEVCNETTNTCDQPGVCGDGIVDAGETCDDGAANGSTTCGCQTDCTYSTAGTSCADGEFCNGDETCDGAGACDAGTPVVCDDGVGCTDDICDEVNDTCASTANDANCPDDGQFCTGTEFCDPVNDCSATGDPCGAGETCNDTTDTCDAATCTDYPDKGTCQMDPACAWVGKGKNGSCQDAPIPGDCAAYVDRNSCNADMACSWNKKAGICEDAGSSVTCSDYSGPGNEALCLANDCNWNSKKQTCR